MTSRHLMAPIAALLTAALLVVQAPAAPVADDERVGLDVRRTTLVVRDIDRSLAFYRDALGMHVMYDNMIRTPRDAETDAAATRSSRLVFLRANDDYIGVIGLLEYKKPVSRPANQGNEPFSTGSVVLLINAHDLETTFAKARNVLGVSVLSEPRQVNYPSYDGKGTIPVMVSVLTDPDGFVVELNQLLVDLVN